MSKTNEFVGYLAKKTVDTAFFGAKIYIGAKLAPVVLSTVFKTAVKLTAPAFPYIAIGLMAIGVLSMAIKAIHMRELKSSSVYGAGGLSQGAGVVRK